MKERSREGRQMTPEISANGEGEDRGGAVLYCMYREVLIPSMYGDIVNIDNHRKI